MMSEQQQANTCAPPVEGPSREEEESVQAEMIGVDASSRPQPLDGDVALQEDSTSVPPSSELVQMFDNNHDHPDTLLSGLNRLHVNNTLCDVVLCCEGQEFSCHRAVMASISSYFEDLFTSDTVESTQERVTISGLEPQVIGMLVNYVYTSELSISTDNAQALQAASSLWNVITDVAITAIVNRYCDFMKPGGVKLVTSLPTKMFEEDYHHTRKVLSGLNRLRVNNTLCDVILCCEGQEFSCHRAVLASISSYFEAMFTSGMMESRQERVTISGLEPQTIGMLVNYFYTSKVSISTANVQALLAASNLWDVEAVQKDCFSYMERHIDIENCVELYCVAEVHSCNAESHSKPLGGRSLDYILEHFTEVYQQEEFLSLSVEGLTKILSSDHLSVPKEDMVFDAAMLWLDNCPTTRKQGFDKVLEHVRLPLISLSYLQHVLESVDVVKEQQACQSSISEAKRERPFSNTARPRRTTVIVTMGGESETREEYQLMSFDPLTAGGWRFLKRLPSETRGHAVVMSGSVVYLAGGLASQFGDGSCFRTGAYKRRDGLASSKEMWRYDAARYSSWSKMADMNEARAYFRLVDLDGHVFAVGGQGSEKSPDSMERYDHKTNSWQLMESVGVAALAYSDCDSGPAVVALDGHLYFIGGAPSHRNPNPPQVAKYNPETSVWTHVSPMQIPRDQPAVCTLNGKIYVTGGRRHNTMNESEGSSAITENTMECFNPETHQWTMCAPMTHRRYWHSTVVVDGKIYVLGGRDDVSYPLVMECYCEETNTWETVGQMHKSLFNLNCVSLRLRNDHYDDDDDDRYYGYNDHNYGSDDDDDDHRNYGYDDDDHDHYYGYNDHIGWGDDDDDYEGFWTGWN